MGVGTGPAGGFTQQPKYGGAKKKVQKPAAAKASQSNFPPLRPSQFGTSKPAPKPSQK